jgi:hypothetical protein
MAFVALVATSLTLQGRSGKVYQLPITRATSSGFCTFTQDGQTFYNLPEDCRVIDAYVGDAVNAADYLDFYIDGIQKIQMRIFEDAVNNSTTVPRTAPSAWMRAGSQLSLYHYSA